MKDVDFVLEDSEILGIEEELFFAQNAPLIVTPPTPCAPADDPMVVVMDDNFKVILETGGVETLLEHSKTCGSTQFRDYQQVYNKKNIKNAYKKYCK